MLALVLLSIVSAIVAFDRWPESGGASSVERIAVDRSEVRRVETELVRAERRAPLVRGVVLVREPTSATASGGGEVFLVADRGPGGQSDGGGFGPPPPPVPFNAPGEGGGVGGGTARSTGNSSPRPGPTDDGGPIRAAACGVGEALGEAGSALSSACKPGSRGIVRETFSTVEHVVGGVQLSR